MNNTQTNSSKLLYRIALTCINGIGCITARHLLNLFQDEETLFRANKKELLAIKGLSDYLANQILSAEVLKTAEKEMEFVIKNNLQTHFINDDNYPFRLKECADAPIIFYFKGKTDLNSSKIISIVGTRKSTPYGDSFCESFISDLSSSYPDLLVLSGLAYGVDINAHRSALKHNLPTVGILAHGLDRIYPAVHRKTAIEMLERGGLLTEFPSGTTPDKFNFVRRNRIVAGMADATVVIESDVKGGSLITANLANSYNREVFALPGRTTDKQSKGCNQLIFQNKASILQSAEDLIEAMNWEQNTSVEKRPQQRELFLNLTSDEQRIYDALVIHSDGLHINLLATQIDEDVNLLFSTLLDLEMRGIIKALPGSAYAIV